MDERKYKIRAGAVIYDAVNQDAGKVMTNANCTDELAEYHLLTNPNSRKYFVDLPENIDEILAEKYPNGFKGAKAQAKTEELPKTTKTKEEKQIEGLSKALKAGKKPDELKASLIKQGMTEEAATEVLAKAQAKTEEK